MYGQWWFALFRLVQNSYMLLIYIYDFGFRVEIDICVSFKRIFLYVLLINYAYFLSVEISHVLFDVGLVRATKE